MIRHFKKTQLLAVLFTACLIIASVSFASAAVVVTDDQIESLKAAAESNGDMKALAKVIVKDLTAKLIADGMTNQELTSQIALAIKELTSWIDADTPDGDNLLLAITDGGNEGALEAGYVPATPEAFGPAGAPRAPRTAQRQRQQMQHPPTQDDKPASPF